MPGAQRLPEATRKAIETVLGEPFTLAHLHPWHVRFRRRYAQSALRLPAPQKLVTSSGRTFKLYVGDAARRFARMQKHAAQAMETGLLPRVLWHDENALLMEFIPGRPVRFNSKAFATELGQAMAALHAVSLCPCDVPRIKSGVQRDLALLRDAGMLGPVSVYAAALQQAWPDRLDSSLDYSDIKPGNFIRDEQGRLRLIDLGALRTQRPAGQYLCGSLYLRRLNRERFTQAYLDAGGLPQVIEQASFLRMLHCVWMAALYLRKLQEVPRWLPLHRLFYRFTVGYLLWEFRRLRHRQTADLVSL